MTDPGRPTADPMLAPTGDAPRLPDAAPAPTPAPAPAPDPHAEPAVVELEERPAPKSSGTPVGFFVLMAMIVGAIIAIAAVVRPWESSPDDAAGAIEEAVTSTADTTAPATTTPTTTAPATTTPATTTPASSTTMLVVGTLPPTPITAASISDDRGVFQSAVEACRLEQRIVFVGLQAFVNTTGAHPNDPDRLVPSGMLEPHPDGWATRWTFDYSEAGIAVVPVAGGPCDL